MVYTVPQAVQYMHDHVPRLDARQGMKMVTNQFGADLLGTDLPYFTAVLSVAGAYFAIGIVSFLIFTLIYMSYACCRPKFRKLPRGGCCAKLCGCLFSARLWSLGAALIMLAGTSACLALVSGFRKATDDTVVQMQSVQSIVANATRATTVFIIPSLSTSATAASQLTADSSGRTVTTLFATLLAGVAGGITSTNSSVGSYAEKLVSLDTLATKVTSGEFDVSTLGTKVWLGGIIALAIFLGSVLLTLFGLLGTKGGACWHRGWSACTHLLSTLLIFIFAGFFVAISVVGSDVCVAPSSSLLSIANATKASKFSQDTVRYYTQCGNTTGTAMAPIGAYASIIAGQTSLLGGLQGIAALQAESTAQGYTWANANILALGAAMSTANSSLTLVSSTVACAPVYGVYASTLSALCGEGIVASIKTWGLATAACVLVYILVSAGARLCWSHPGDALDPVDENKPGEAAVAPAGAHRGQYVMPATGAAPQLMYAAPVARHGAGGAAQYA